MFTALEYRRVRDGMKSRQRLRPYGHLAATARHKRGRHSAAFALATALAFVALAAFVPASANASHSTCWREARSVRDDASRLFTYRYHCSTYVSSAVYANPYNTAPLDDSGYMYAAHDVWVICQKSGRPNPIIQGNTNTYWLYTQGDLARPNGYGYRYGWGYLPATAIKQGGQNQAIPGVPICPYWY